jgi:hypothetical protein
MDVTISIDAEAALKASLRAQAMGTSVEQLVRDYLKQLGDTGDPQADAAEFEELSLAARGNSRGWRFDRVEIHALR